jgi:hypothetical protein
VAGAGAGAEAAAGGADDLVGTGTESPISVFERSGLVVLGRGVITADAAGAADGRGAADGDALGAAGMTDTGAAAMGAAGDEAAGPPQSVSMSSVDGGTEGNGAFARGGWLEAGRGGTDEVRPWVLARSPSSLLTTLFRSHTRLIWSSQLSARPAKITDKGASRWNLFLSTQSGAWCTGVGSLRSNPQNPIRRRAQLGGGAKMRTLGSVNSSTANATPSRPMPESFTPP